MNIIQAHAVNNLCYIKGEKMMPQGIVVHSTGANNPNLKRYVDAPDEVGVNSHGNHWNNPTPGGKKVCVHAFIGYDKDKKVRVAEILPLNICAWGVGNGSEGSYNYDPAYIQFEICEDSLSDRTYYEKAFGVAAEYCAYLCERFGLKVENIVGHNEAHKLGYGSNHSDPEHWTKKHGETMNDFRRKVSKLLLERKEKKDMVYCIHIGAFSNSEDVEVAVGKIKALGYEANVVPCAVILSTIKEEPIQELVTSEKKPVDQVAKEVIQGKWGSGNERKRRLEEAGYDPSEVQAKVNELLR